MLHRKKKEKDGGEKQEGNSLTLNKRKKGKGRKKKGHLTIWSLNYKVLCCDVLCDALRMLNKLNSRLFKAAVINSKAYNKHVRTHECFLFFFCKKRVRVIYLRSLKCLSVCHL